MNARHRYEVTPPLRRVQKSQGGGLVRLVQSEGWIDVEVKNGRLILRSSQALSIRSHASNVIEVTLIDDERGDQEVVR